MSLYEDWLSMAYDKEGHSVSSLWDKYLPLETDVYKQLISEKINLITGTVKELGARFHMPIEYICGFVDGINGALDEQVEVKDMMPDDFLKLEFDFKNLYKKMVDYKADHLYNLPEWEGIFDSDTRKILYREQKSSTTIVKKHEPGRNEPCPCGSGKKYKKCCGAV